MRSTSKSKLAEIYRLYRREYEKKSTVESEIFDCISRELVSAGQVSRVSIWKDCGTDSWKEVFAANLENSQRDAGFSRECFQIIELSKSGMLSINFRDIRLWRARLGANCTKVLETVQGTRVKLYVFSLYESLKFIYYNDIRGITRKYTIQQRSNFVYVK